MTTVLRAGSATHPGQVRANNEDAKLTLDRRRLWAVADGVGGHQAGEVASAMAVEIIEQGVTDPTPEALIAAVVEANAAINERASNDPELRGMGTTLCAIAVVDADDDGEEIVWVNVGDSRIYLFRDDTIQQLSRDHTLVEDLRRDGQITADEAASHPKRNIITRALGLDPAVEVDSKRVMALNADRFLLCSDGLYDELTDDQIAATLRRLADPGEAANDLVRQANDHGGRDNVTVVVVDVIDDGGRATAAAEAAQADQERARERAAAEAAAAAVADDPTTQSLPTVAAGAMAGFGVPAPAATASPNDDGDGDLPFGRSTQDLYEDLDHQRTRHITWRVVFFLVALLAVLGVAFGAVGWYAKRTYYVDYAGQQVAIYQGQPGGLLIFEPEVKVRTTVDRADLTEAESEAVAKQQTFSSLADARTFANNLTTRVEARIEAQNTTTTVATTTTTVVGTTTTPATTTTAP